MSLDGEKNSKNSSMVDINSIIEGTVKFRDGKKVNIKNCADVALEVNLKTSHHDIKIQYDMLQIILRGNILSIRIHTDSHYYHLDSLSSFHYFAILKLRHSKRKLNIKFFTSLTFYPKIHPQTKATWINVSEYQHQQPSCILVHCSPHYYNNLLCCIYVLCPFPFLFSSHFYFYSFIKYVYRNSSLFPTKVPFFKYAEPKKKERNKKIHELLM